VWDCAIELLDVKDQGARWRIEDVYFDFDGDRCDHALLVLFGYPDQDLLVDARQFRNNESGVGRERGPVMDTRMPVITSQGASELVDVVKMSVRGDVRWVLEVDCESLSLGERKFVEVEICC
jgi:hypothetical protein